MRSPFGSNHLRMVSWNLNTMRFGSGWTPQSSFWEYDCIPKENLPTHFFQKSWSLSCCCWVFWRIYWIGKKQMSSIWNLYIYIYIVMWWFCRQDPCDFNMFFRFDKDCASKLKTHICPTPETGVSTYGSKPSDPRNSCGSLYFLFTSFVNPYNIYNGLGGFQTYFSSPVVQLGSQKPPTSVFFKCVFHRPAFGIHQQLQIFT